ncbi:MAG: hypothetical protein RSB36_04695 [Hydrogenoanaerobacterium sp.]
MEIQDIGNSSTYSSPITRANDVSKKALEVAKEAVNLPAKGEDTFVKGETTTEVTYKPPKKLTADQRRDIDTQMADSYRQMLTDMVSKQASAFNQISGAAFNKITASKKDMTNPLDPSSAIAPGGEYSVDAVATRLIDMAKALSGGDKSKINLLRDAVRKGFKAAGAELGGSLPSISNDTLTETMKRFDEWEKEE